MEIRYALRELLSERTRLLLTIVAIAWGTLSITLMLAVGQGLLVSLTGYMEQMGSNLVVAMPGASDNNFEGTLAGTPVNFSDEDYQAISKLPSVKDITAEYSTSITMTYLDKNAQPILSGVKENYRNMHPVKLVRGRFINQDDIYHSREVLVLGNNIATQLFGAKDPLGQYVQMGPFNFQVIGVAEKGSDYSTFYGMPNNYLTWIPYTTFESLFPSQNINYILVRGKNTNIKMLQNLIRSTIAHLHHLSPKDEDTVHFVNNEDVIENTTSFFIGLQWFLGAIGTITLLIASVGIANIMYLAIQRAISVIGIRMALGAKIHQIVSHYIFEAVLVSALGGILGFIFSAISIFTANLILPNINLFGLTGIHLTLSIPLTGIIIFILTIVGLAAGIFPALRAARIQPVEALRHE